MEPTLDRIVRSPRLAARRRAVRAAHRRRKRRVVMALLLVGLLGSGGVVVSRSLLFDLTSIEVVGARGVTRDDVIAASGLRVGQSALGLDLAEAATLVERLAGIASARVERAGSLGVRIVVRERVPALRVRSGTRSWFLDATGQPVAGPARGPVPVMVASSAPGVGVLLPAGSVRAVLSVWKSMPAGMRANLTAFETPVDGLLRFRLGTTDVVFGPLERVGEKIRALRLVRQRVAADDLRLVAVDLTAPGRPAARIR